MEIHVTVPMCGRQRYHSMTDMTDGKINLSCGEPYDYWIYDTMTDMTDVFPNFIKSTMV